MRLTVIFYLVLFLANKLKKAGFRNAREFQDNIFYYEPFNP